MCVHSSYCNLRLADCLKNKTFLILLVIDYQHKRFLFSILSKSLKIETTTLLQETSICRIQLWRIHFVHCVPSNFIFVFLDFVFNR